MRVTCPWCGDVVPLGFVTCGASECQQAAYVTGQALLRPRSKAWAAVAREAARAADEAGRERRRRCA